VFSPRTTRQDIQKGSPTGTVSSSSCSPRVYAPEKYGTFARHREAVSDTEFERSPIREEIPSNV
jgi:hypothetical protein